MEQTDSCQRKGGWEERWKERERSSQRTCMNDPWTRTTEREWTVGERGGLGGEHKREKNWDNCNRINNKKVISLAKFDPVYKDSNNTG